MTTVGQSNLWHILTNPPRQVFVNRNTNNLYLFPSKITANYSMLDHTFVFIINTIFEGAEDMNKCFLLLFILLTTQKWLK